MTEPASIVTAFPSPTKADLLRFVGACLVHDARSSDRFLSHALRVDLQPADKTGSLQRWTQVVRECRHYIEPLEATDWWAAARAAEHAWADPGFLIDAAVIDAQVDRVARSLAVMPAVDRIALLLRDVENMPISTVAEVMRGSEEAAVDRVRRARMTLVCALDPTSMSHVQPPLEWPGEGECATTRMALLTASRRDLAEILVSAEHLGGCSRCASLTAGLIRVVEGLTTWANAAPPA